MGPTLERRLGAETGSELSTQGMVRLRPVILYTNAGNLCAGRSCQVGRTEMSPFVRRLTVRVLLEETDDALDTESTWRWLRCIDENREI